MTSHQAHLSHPKYRPDIDGLRAIAVLSVVAFHAFPSSVRGGFIGVDVFFVISGYLISSIIFENLDKGTFSFSEFYSRRIRRIFPALLLVLIACFAFGWFVLLADEYKQLGKHIAAGAGFISNFILWNEAGYFDNSAETKPLLHLWSLGIEEQFYIVWPLLLWFAWKRKFNLLTITTIVAVASFVLNLKGVNQDMVSTFYSPQTRFWELLSGSLLAWFTLYKKDTFTGIKRKINVWLSRFVYSEKQVSDSKTLANLLSFVGLLLLLYGFWRINKDLSFPGKWALVPVLGAVLIITAGSKAWFNRTILSNKLAVWFGLISFPLYLWHWPILSFARIVESEVPSRNIRIAAVVLSIVLAWVTYKLIERPLRFGKHGNVKVAALVLLMAIVGYVGYNTYERDGLRFRAIFKEKAFNAVAFEWPDIKNKTPDCLSKISPYTSGYCVFSKGLPIKVALIGDSHANAIYDYVRDYYARRGIGVIQLGQGGCPPFLGVERDASNCPKIMNDVVSYLENNKDITRVFVTGRFAATLSGVNFGGETPPNFYSLRSVANPDITNRSQIFEEGFKAIISRLLSSKKDVTVILDLPELDFNPKSCLNRVVGNNCLMEKFKVVERQSAYRQIISNVASQYKFNVIDLVDAFCIENYCNVKSNAKILYRDTHHLGIWGNEFLSERNFRLD
uniref:acyltransferase family protein n=1 Tax=Orrella sp. TaxID=1921583 RepID=UPI0040487A81